MRNKTHRELIKGWNPFTDEEIKRYVSKGFWQNLTICDLLDRNAEILPNKLAAVDDATQVTWKELQYRSKRIAIHLKKLGVKYGDFFVLQMPNTIEFLYMFLGLNRLGAIPIMCVPRHGKIEVNHMVSLHEAKGIAVATRKKFDYVGMVEEIRQGHPYLEILLTVGGETPPGWLSVEQLMKEEVEKDYPEDYLEQFKPDPNDICAELLSGGTTGLPKAIPRTNNDYICDSDYACRAYGSTDESVSLAALPLGHGFPIVCVVGQALLKGNTVVLTKLRKAEDIFEIIERHGVTHLFLVEIQMIYLKEAKELAKAHNLSSLKAIVGPLRPDLVKWGIQELGVSVINMFGMAEGQQTFGRWDSPEESQMYTIGRPILVHPENVIRLVDDNNKDVQEGEIGEMVTKGPMVFKGYFRNEEENRKAFDEQGFFHSGDLMSVRKDGRFVFEGRKKYMIKRGGENIYPEAVEALLMRHPKIEFCATVGIPDVRLGESLGVFVQPVKGETITLDEIAAHMKEKGMSIFQCPERLEIVNGWPLSPSQKINKRLLKAYITTKLYQEGAIDKEYANSYLKLEKVDVDSILSGEVQIEFAGTPT